VDTSGNIMDVNDRIEEVLGYNKDAIIGKNFTNLGLIGFSEIPRLFKLFANGIRNRKAIGLVNIELRHKDGRKFQFEVSTRFINNKKGKTVGVVNIFREITERERSKI
jgi:PAS domain S-box-containing protein